MTGVATQAAPATTMRYPLFLDLKDQPVVVIGAGRVATRKVRTLLTAGAEVTVIAPRATPAVRGLASAKRIHWLRRGYRAGDLRAARLVIAATDDKELNRRICADAKRRRLLVNCVAPPAAGNFIVPAVVRTGGLTIAISTGGVNPSLAKRLRQELEVYLRDRYGEQT
jgi:siroheme synthase-like protein